MTEEDILTIRHKAQEAHDRAKLVLTQESAADLEVQRDDCTEKKNAVITIINSCEDQLEGYRKQKRAIDDKMADVRQLQREFEGYKADLSVDEKRLNNAYWDIKKGRKPANISDASQG